MIDVTNVSPNEAIVIWGALGIFGAILLWVAVTIAQHLVHRMVDSIAAAWNRRRKAKGKRT